nr:DsbA family protein [Pseudovibrio flavus]
MSIGAVSLSAVGFSSTGALAATEEQLMFAGPLGEKELGSKDAPVTVIEYASMTCGHCATFHNTTYKPFLEKYVDTGKVHFIFREFPFDPVAAAAFMLARCAPEEKYFDIITFMFEQQRQWAFSDNPRGAIFNLGKQIGFTQKEIEECLTNQEILDGVTTVRNHAANVLGVDATPTFFINGEKVSGALSIDEISKYVDKHL